MKNIPLGIDLLFLFSVLFTLWMFYLAGQKNKTVMLVSMLLLIIQGILGLLGFYTNTSSLPPRFILLPFPPLLLIAWLMLSKTGKTFITQLSMRHLILLHVVRIPVEIVLFSLSLNKVVPITMTFEGLNFDIISGISAIPVYYFFQKQKLHHKILWIWNIVCLLLLLNIVAIAVLSAPFPFQRLAFDQPNIAVLYLPYNLLPGYIVTVVLFAHLAALKKLKAA